MEDFFTKETTPGYIYDFLINQWNLGGRSFGDKEPPCYDQAGCRDWSERTINKPVLQMSIITPELKEKDDNKNIPYLEYQILTDNPIANNSQIYTAIVRYNDQVYKLEKEIDRKVNVIDFAVHN